MKQLFSIILLFCVCAVNAYTQELKPVVPFVDKKVEYSKVVETNNTKDALYGKAKLWFANTFNSSKEVIQIDDKENGVILGKGKIVDNDMAYMSKTKKTWDFTVKIQVKDNKYKAVIYDIDYTFELPGNNIGAGATTVNLNNYFNDTQNYNSDGTLRKKGLKFGENANSVFEGMLESINKAMNEEINSDF